MFNVKSSVKYGSIAASSNVTAYSNSASQLTGTAVNFVNGIIYAASPIWYETLMLVSAGVTLVGGSHTGSATMVTVKVVDAPEIVADSAVVAVTVIT